MAEIMAPAGSREQLVAAVRSGAHRVYFGCGEFNARRNADGFDSPGSVIEYCHARGVKATAALNILLTDDELPRAAALIQQVAQAGGDGIIIQDLAAYRLAKEICPGLPLHASTQMTVHNVQGAKALEAMGFSRGVLARELSLEEIRAIRQATAMELEVFVHGALCMCVSGQCYLSSLLGGRSGNRGLCAQPCRLPFTRADGKGYALSLKDMSHLSRLKELADMGVDSFKIEGRMKRPEYAAAAVTQALAALDGKQPDEQLLGAVFARSGFTDGYLTGKRTEDMFGHRVKEDTADTGKVLPLLSALYRKERQQVPVDMELTVLREEPIALTLTAENQSVTVNGPPPSPAVKRPLTYDFAKECLFKCGGTPYLPAGFSARIGEGLNLPIPVLKDLRKAGLAQLTRLRVDAQKRPVGNCPTVDSIPYRPARPPFVYVAAETFEQVEQLPADRIYLPAGEILRRPGLAAGWGKRLFADLPALSFAGGGWEELLTKVKAAGISGVRVQNIGAVPLAKAMGFTVSGGTGLNILNTVALEEYAGLGLDDATLSFELTGGGLSRLGGKLPRGVTVYGYLPLMRMRACPLKRGNSCGDCPGRGILTDRKGVRFSLKCHERRFTTLYNSVPLYLGDKKLPVDFTLLEFTGESPAECRERYAQVMRREKPNFPHTCGLYDRNLL